ncbi:MAG: hypothetical protein ABI923_04940 [bacterium]
MKHILLSTGLLLLTMPILHLDLVAQTPKGRAEALRTFKSCMRPVRPTTLDCSEEFVANVIAFYNRADHSVLRPLLDAGLSSDGDLSEELGGFYADVIAKNPRSFLAALGQRNIKQQRHLCWMAGAEDGGGMPKETLHQIKGESKVKKREYSCKVTLNLSSQYRRLNDEHKIRAGHLEVTGYVNDPAAHLHRLVINAS